MYQKMLLQLAPTLRENILLHARFLTGLLNNQPHFFPGKFCISDESKIAVRRLQKV